METGRMRPLPLIIRGLDRPEIQAGKHLKIYASPLAMEAAQSSIREEDRNVQKRDDFWTEIQTRTRRSEQTRTLFWRREPRA